MGERGSVLSCEARKHYVCATWRVRKQMWVCRWAIQECVGLCAARCCACGAEACGAAARAARRDRWG